jgi:hypothetical protein
VGTKLNVADTGLMLSNLVAYDEALGGP